MPHVWFFDSDYCRLFPDIADPGSAHTGKSLHEPLSGRRRSTQTDNGAEYVEFDTSSSIRISDEAKQKLEAVKREDETFDELLDRLPITRTDTVGCNITEEFATPGWRISPRTYSQQYEEDVRELAGFADEDVEEHMKQKREDLNASFEARTSGTE